jgi:hypothetical protein
MSPELAANAGMDAVGAAGKLNICNGLVSRISGGKALSYIVIITALVAREKIIGNGDFARIEITAPRPVPKITDGIYPVRRFATF